MDISRAALRATVDIARRRLAEIRLQHEELLDIIEDLEARVRATDGTGRTQPEERTGVFPDGARGWHEIQFVMPE